CLIDVLVLDVEDRIHTVLAAKRSKPILPAPSGESFPVSRRHSLQVQLGRPPAGESILELQPGCVIDGVAVLGYASRVRQGDLQISRLLEIMIVRDEVRTLLRAGRLRRRDERQQQARN